MEIQHAPFVRPLRAFPERQRPALEGLTLAMFGREHLEGERLSLVIDETDRHIAEASLLLRLGLVLLLDVLRLLPLVVIGRFAIFEALALDEQRSFLEAVERSPRLALPLVPYKTLLTIAFYELPGELESLGYSRSRRRFLLEASAKTGSLTNEEEPPS